MTLDPESAAGMQISAHEGEALAERFCTDGRLQIDNFLTRDSADRLYQRLLDWKEWALVTRIQGRHHSFDAAAMAAMPPDKRAGFDDLVAADARNGFQYLYERYPLYDLARAGHLSDATLGQAYALLRSPAFLELMRQITGVAEIRFADGQFTCYRRGHFLTLHDDAADGMGRVAAYVLNLTPRWAADFGGQLQFTAADGRVLEAIVPRYNTLSLFRVPSPHLVTAVAPFVSEGRYALTGWLRRGDEPTLSIAA